MPSQSVGKAKGQHRYPLALAARCRVLGAEKHFYVGITLEISSAVVALKTSHPLPIGVRLMLDIDWPATLDGIPLKLRLDGVVQGGAELLRGHRYVLEIQIRRWEFRLSKRGAGDKGAAHEVGAVRGAGQALTGYGQASTP